MVLKVVVPGAPVLVRNANPQAPTPDLLSQVGPRSLVQHSPAYCEVPLLILKYILTYFSFLIPLPLLPNKPLTLLESFL